VRVPGYGRLPGEVGGADPVAATPTRAGSVANPLAPKASHDQRSDDHRSGRGCDFKVAVTGIIGPIASGCTE
jgi:hypothetical protein